MTNEAAREVFNQAAANHRAAGNLDAVANVELVREYLTNPQFRTALSDYVWTLNKATGAQS